MLKLLCEDGSLVKVKDGLYFHGPVIQELKARMQRGSPPMTISIPPGSRSFPAAFPASTSSRFSNISTVSAVTIRVGDKRQFRGRG